MIASKLSKKDLNFLLKVFVLANFICLCFFLANIQLGKEIKKYHNNLDIKEEIINSKLTKDLIKNKKIQKELEFQEVFLKKNDIQNKFKLKYSLIP